MLSGESRVAFNVPLVHPNKDGVLTLFDRAFVVCDRVGRLWATRQLCVLWVLGIAIFMGNNGHLGAVYAGRFIAGLGVGQSVVVGKFVKHL